MRRSDMEFKNEVLRRASAYKARQKKLRKTILTTALCALLVCAGSWGLMNLGMGGSSKECAPAGDMNLAAGSAEGGMILDREEMDAVAAEPEACPEAPGAVEFGTQSSAAENGAGSRIYNVEFIEINTIPETDETYRYYTDAEQIAAIENAIEWIYTTGSCDKDSIKPGGSTVYEIIVAYKDSAVRYELYGNAMYCESDDSWITVDEDTYQRLLNAISQNEIQ